MNCYDCRRARALVWREGCALCALCYAYAQRSMYVLQKRHVMRENRANIQMRIDRIDRLILSLTREEKSA